jgi:uncharacterized protein YqeY
LRLARASLQNAEIAWQREATEAEIIAIIRREIGQHAEALEFFQRAGRQDLITQEEVSIRALERYVPHNWARTISATFCGASSPRSARRARLPSGR